MTATPRTLDALLRLERRRLDVAGGVIREAGAEHARAIERCAQGRARLERERQTGSANPALRPWLTSYLEAARVEAAALSSEIERLEEAHRAAVDAALEARLHCRRLDLLAARAWHRGRRAEARRRERQLEALLPHLGSGLATQR